MSVHSTARKRRLVAVCLLALCVPALSACEWTDLINGDDGDDNNVNTGDNTPPATDTNVPGLSVAVSASDFDTTLANTRSAIGNSANTDTFTSVDHQANARGVNRELRDTTVILFDNPNRSSALIAADPRAALDLPMRVLVYRDGAGGSGGDNTGTGQGTMSDQPLDTVAGSGNDNTPGTAQGSDADTDGSLDQGTGTNQDSGAAGDTPGGNVAVAYTNAAYLDARYNLDGAEAGTLDAFNQDLAAIAATATGATPSTGAATGVSTGEGIERAAGDDDFTSTVDQLAAAINARDSLTLIQTVDFQSRGGSRGLNPSTLLIFGNPEVGTQFMQSSQTVGVDLPQKMLVSADASGNVTLYYNDPAFIADRHGIDNRDDEIEAVRDLLADLADEAAGNSGSMATATGTTGAATMDSTGASATP